MNHEPLIDEANNVSAFITNEEGYDVAVLERVHRTALPPMLTDAEWQSLINLINAAPVMLESLQEIVRLQDTEAYDLQARDSMAALARAAITKATK